MEDLKNVLIKVAVEEWLPYTQVTIHPGGNITVGGPIGNLLEILAQHLDFECALVRPPDSFWGIKFPNGSWNGMMGMVHRNEVEFALGPFAVTAQREEDVDFSMAVLTDNQAIITRRPTLQEDVGGFLKPFSAKVWVLVLLSMVGVAGTMVAVVMAEARIYGTKSSKVVSRACLWVLTTVTQESSEWMPQHDGGRVLVTTWMLASLVFMSSYGGILTALLTVPRVTIPIDSLADLVAQKNLPWRLESGAMMLTYLQESEDAVRQKAYYGMSGTIPDCWTAREGLVKARFAAICDETTMKKTISWDFSTSGECHLYIAREKVYTNVLVSLAFRTDSFLLAGANTIISRLREAGILVHWITSHTSNTTLCLKPPSADRSKGVQPLPIRSLLGTMFFLVAGWCAGLLTFLGENLLVALLPPPSSPRTR